MKSRDGVHIELRVGLNSGEVIAGDVGSSPWSYTAVGHQVGLAQRMESLAAPGGVMLSESTARLVAGIAVLGEPEGGQVKGADQLVPARPLLSMRTGRPRPDLHRRVSTLVGRKWELAALTAMLDQAIAGRGRVVSVVGPGGIGKSRTVDEVVAMTATLGHRVISTYCESHTSEVPFLVISRLLRAAFGVEGMTDHEARKVLRERVPDADPADQVVLEDTLGFRDPDDELPDIAPDARRRRLTATVNTVGLAVKVPRIFVIEDAHWIDKTSESLLADFLTVVPHTPSLVLLTYRPEYTGALSRLAGAQTISLAPLDFAETTALASQLLGADTSVAALTAQIAQRSGGNPLFVEEMVRDLTDRGVLAGTRGAHVKTGQSTGVTVPATLQAAIAARIDRLDGAAKATLNAAAVIGFRFRAEVLAALADTSKLADLVRAELIEQVTFTGLVEYAFRQPLIQAVAYQSQLIAGRTALHKRLAAALAERDPASADERAALIAQHLEAAGELAAAFGWHMRAATWLTHRDIRAARKSWQHARDVADALPTDAAGRAPMRITPRALLCLTAFRVGASATDGGFEELQALAVAADDKASLAIGMTGQMSALVAHGHYEQAAAMVDELMTLADSLGDSILSVGLLLAALSAKFGTGELTELVRLADRVIADPREDMAQGAIIFGSPLTFATMQRAGARMCGGAPGWRDDVDSAVAMSSEVEPGLRAALLLYIYGIGVANGLLIPDDTMLSVSESNLRAAEERADEFALASARFLRGLVLAHLDEPQRAEGLEVLALSLKTALQNRINQAAVRQLNVERAREQARTGDLDGAITLLRDTAAQQTTMGFRGAASTALVETLLQRREPADVDEAAAVVEELAAVPTEPAFVLFDVALLRLRALLARARGDEASYRDFAERYRAMATSFGFEGHMALAQAM